ncbi:MAG: sulfotransferase [Anaerolineales bacterium]
MNDHKKKPILVTGSHRSGSTWAGVMLSAPPDIAYVNEPFNIEYKPGSCRPHFQYWYTYVCEENESAHVQYIRDCLRYKPHAIRKALQHGSLEDIPRLVRFQIQCLKARLMKKRPLVKDPLALFSTEWMAERFNMEVVILIRHPAAFVGSLKAAGWPFPFSHLLNQPLLMDRYLSGYAEEIEDFARHDRDLIDQAILLWNLIYSVVRTFQQEHGADWLYVKHEDLSRDPVGEYRKLYEKLGIPFSDQARYRINKFSFAETENKHMKRDSKSNIWKWKKRLTEGEISRVREKTGEVAGHFYTEDDWING